MRRAALVAAALLAATVTGGCRRSDAPFALDGSPRVADDAGVATTVSRESITLDSAREYDVADSFVSFSATTGDVEPMLGRRDQFVQVGVRDDKVIWMAGFASPVELGGRRVVFFEGRIDRISDGKAYFRGGTVIDVDRGAGRRRGGDRVQAMIDVSTGRILEW